jgi:D-alanyl-D-alanine carboxypeptidase
VPLLTRFRVVRTLMWAGLACLATALAASRAQAEALLVVEAESGKVIYAHNAAYPWYPASTAKLMTAYVTLRAVKEGRLALDQPLVVSANAAAQAPVKMGFGVGTQVTVDNALKMLMVKSANDIAVVLAEGVAGSVENFADQMNRHARRLGMTQSTFVNPNGLPADDQISSARDLAILARALIREMPEYDHYWHLPGIRMGKKVQWNYNTLIGRYPGADGMKTGFICASGFNLVASATRGDKRIIAVVLGAPSSAARALKAAQLLERGFNSNTGLSWLLPSLGTVEAIEPINAVPPNLRDEMCGAHRKRPASENEDEHLPTNTGPDSPYGVFLASLRPRTNGAPLLQEINLGQPVLVYTGTRPPEPGAPSASTDAKPKPEKKKAVAGAKPPASKDGTAAAATAAKPGAGAAKPAATPAAGDAGPAKPKPKKPAPKPAPTAITPAATQHTSQAR